MGWKCVLCIENMEVRYTTKSVMNGFVSDTGRFARDECTRKRG